MSTKINLIIPRSWNHCTTPQLELIADILREQAERQDRYHPFSMLKVKTAVFFALSGIEVLEYPNPRVPVDEQYYTCRLASQHKKHFSFSLFSKDRGETSFPLYLWQLNYWLHGFPKSVHIPGDLIAASKKSAILDWLDRDSGIFLTKFPYPLIYRPSFSHIFNRKISFQGPNNNLDGFSWSQYRLATESMQKYVTLSNNFVKMKQMNKFSPSQLALQSQSADSARSFFLATIFNRKIKYIDSSTGIARRDYHYQSDQTTANASYFRNFSDTQWQVILFWWTGIIHTLSKRYPHVFKVQKISNSQKPVSALDIYTATIASMQKYVGINEQDCNNQSYTLVLEQLERISKENEELDRIRHSRP